MSRIGLTLLFSMFILFGPYAPAVGEEGQDANFLREACKISAKFDSPESHKMTDDDVKYGISCRLYLQGVTDAYYWSLATNIIAKKLKGDAEYPTSQVHPRVFPFCLPNEGYANPQGARIVTRYLEQHPELLHLTTIEVVMLAFTDAFPC